MPAEVLDDHRPENRPRRHVAPAVAILLHFHDPGGVDCLAAWAVKGLAGLDAYEDRIALDLVVDGIAQAARAEERIVRREPEPLPLGLGRFGQRRPAQPVWYPPKLLLAEASMAAPWASNSSAVALGKRWRTPARLSARAAKLAESILRSLRADLTDGLVGGRGLA